MNQSANTIKTSVWLEEARAGNPFYPEQSYCRGYDFYGELLGKVSWPDLAFLHLRGELPTASQGRHFNLLLAAVMNPGPRDLQNRAAMSSAIGGCPVGTALLAGLTCAQGELSGGAAVEKAMTTLAGRLQGIPLNGPRAELSAGELETLGFGLYYGGADHRAIRLIACLKEAGLNGIFVDEIVSIAQTAPPSRQPCLHGVFAASLLDLGFTPRQGHGLYMIACSFSMLAFLTERYSEKWYEYPTWFNPGAYQYTKPAGEKT